MHSQSDAGIWIPQIAVKDGDESEEDITERLDVESQSEETSAGEERDADDASASAASVGFGRFSALSLEDPKEDSSSDEELE
jgi:hypothetical protein